MSAQVPYYSASLAARTYDLLYGPLLQAQVEFYVAQAQLHGGPVLELGAGTGLVSWAVAAAGHEITATDQSAAMLDLAKAKSYGHPDEVRKRISFARADMTNFDLGQSFRCAFIPGRSFMHLLTSSDQRKALTAIHQHLDDRGVLVMNQYDPRLDYCLPGSMPPVADLQGEDANSRNSCRRTLLDRETDPLTQTFTEKLRIELFDSDGKLQESEETEWSLRWTYQQEMRYLFELCGFEVLRLYSDFDRSPPSYGAEQVWICQKV